MRRPVLFLACFTVTLCGSFQAAAENGASYEPGQMALIDRMAADFFETELHPAQSRTIENSIADQYRTLSLTDRKRFRDRRRLQWRAMTDAERNALRGAKSPTFSHLSEDRKSTFRNIALDRLTAGGDETPRSADTEI
ncbi:MAG: DUF3106 domain-containing protein [Marinicaulis sp.]|nr:DUF3106 domain-containing protein [Marinicaulis sp.]